MKHAYTPSSKPPRKSLRQRCVARIKRPPRLSGWGLITLVLAALVWAIAPQQLPVSLYKLSLVTLAGVVGYWLDRSMFPYARPRAFVPDDPALDAVPEAQVCTLLAAPEEVLGVLGAAAMLRRAIIVAATMLAMGLGA